MSKKPSAQAFLAAMQGGQQEAEDQPVKARPAIVQAVPPVTTTPDVAELPTSAREASRPAKAKPGRAQLKHFGGYLDDDTLEKIALLRVRLKKDNSELIKLAIDELHKKHNAKRAFGDA
jgi:hypothetical protein